MFWQSWTRGLFCLTGLDRGFFIGTDDPDALLEQSRGLFIQVQHRAGTLEKSLGILDVLPRMELPGADLFGGEPTPNRPSFNGGQSGNGCGMTGQFGSTPMSERNAVRARQAIGQRRHLGTDL